ncbi:NAD+ synthase [Halostagnicola kamekurae]|uniref:NH(3)-dependent NAD(+) synthetase n=1 Tax=Halostagnicola kamekurae TaxID=619731 RepID=A0A1I6U9G7_9EURY|nr:NAD+ synthase [Halostagnicola kamekurae]SFS98083.1 NAD+ synthase [Halostagnicola kamekurae]
MTNLYEQTQSEIEPLDLRFSERELEARVDHLTDFVVDEVNAADVDGALIALSGGIDSTTTANLAVEALGADAVHGLLLPKEVNEDANMSDAERVARELDISYDVLEVDGIVDEILDTYDADPEDDSEGSWEGRYIGNTSARVRMLLNYLVAGYENKLVLGTGNRAELATGYVTKYGDGGVDCNPLGNLYKQQVRQLAAHLGVDESLVQKTPTGGMVDYDTDEEEFGVDYDTLDAVLALHVDGGVPAAATARLTDTSIDEVEHIVEMHEQSDHKRTPPSTPEPL